MDRTVFEDGKIRQYKDRMDHSPKKAIRAHCVECMGGNAHDIPGCSSPKCALYLFRMGAKRPSPEDVAAWKSEL